MTLSGTEDERPNTAKDSPVAFIAQEIPTVWGTVREKYMRNIVTECVFQMTKCILIWLISQSITLGGFKVMGLRLQVLLSFLWVVVLMSLQFSRLLQRYPNLCCVCTT